MRIAMPAISMVLSALVVGGVLNTPAYSKTITLKVWTWLADQSEGKLYKKWVSEYERTHPGVRIKLDIAGGAVTDKVLSAYAAGEPLDVFRIGAAGLTQFANKGLLRPVDGPMLRDINVNDLLKSVVVSGTYKGKLYGWDPHISGSTLDYNTTIFDKAGLPYPNHDFTWDDLALAARKTTIVQGNRTTQWGFANSEAFTLLRLMSLCYDRTLWNLKTGEPTFTDGEVVKAVESIKRMAINYKCMPVGYAQYNRTLFSEGKLAMVVEGSFMNPTYMSSSKLKYKVTWTPRGTVRAFMPWPCMWVMSKNSKYPREQWDFFRYWVGKQNSMEFTDFGGPKAYGAPVWKSALNDPKYKICDMLKEQISQDEFARPDPWLGFLNTERFSTEADLLLQNIYNDKVEVRQGLDTLNKRSKAIMKYLGR